MTMPNESERKKTLEDLLEQSAIQRRLEGSFTQLINDLTKQFFILNMARRDKRAGGQTRLASAERAIKQYIRAWVELNPECICWDGNPESYEGPQRDCPIHGEKAQDKTTEGERA